MEREGGGEREREGGMAKTEVTVHPACKAACKVPLKVYRLFHSFLVSLSLLPSINLALIVTRRNSKSEICLAGGCDHDSKCCLRYTGARL